MDYEEKSCHDKAAFDSQEKAQAAMAQAQWQYGKDGRHLKPYLCPDCHLYHLATDYGDDIIEDSD